MKRLLCTLTTLACLQLYAHPMGNFSVSHYSRIVVEPKGASVRYVLDLAEIPTFELLQQWNLTQTSAHHELHQRTTAQMRQWVRNLSVKVDGKLVIPQLEETEFVMADGAGNMPVMRITARLRIPAEAGKLEYEDRNFPDRAGWKEIVVGSGEDRSQGLTAYPQDPQVSPPQDLRASVKLMTDTPVPAPVQTKTLETAAAPEPVSVTASAQPGASAPGMVVRGDYLSQLLGSKELTWSMILLGIVVAFGLGAMHAFSPGHGKTMVAAYLVGARGTWKHAVFLGGMVTFTHTISVFALGFVTLFLSRYILPEKLEPILGVISGITIIWVGAMLLYKRAQKLSGHSHGQHHHHDHDHVHDHHHDHDHAHDHHHDHDHEHHHGPGGHTHIPEGEVTIGSLIALGAGGGLVPCPSGLVILLSSIALGRVGIGITWLIGFSAGLAVVLTSIGVLVVYAKDLLPKTQSAMRSPVFRLLPVVSAGLVIVIGILMTSVSLGWISPGKLIG